MTIKFKSKKNMYGWETFMKVDFVGKTYATKSCKDVEESDAIEVSGKQFRKILNSACMEDFRKIDY